MNLKKLKSSEFWVDKEIIIETSCYFKLSEHVNTTLKMKMCRLKCVHWNGSKITTEKLVKYIQNVLSRMKVFL